MTTLERRASQTVSELEDQREELKDEFRPLAKDLAKELVPWETTIDKHGLTTEQFSELLDAELFQELLTEERAKWKSPENTAARVMAKSQLNVEDGLLSIASIVSNPKVNPVVRVKAFSEMIKVAGTDNVAASRAQGGTGRADAFSISINLGGNREPMRVSGSVESEEDGEVQEEAVYIPADPAER